MREFTISKSPGPDNIHPRILHDLSEALCIPTTIIFNTSLATKTIPDDWKEGCITAIFKKGSRKHASNYRTVSLTCILCKLLESFVRDHIVSHMKKNGLFSNRQYGFLSGRSTTLQLQYVLERWTEILDNGGSLDAIYFDFMKAFDTVPHQRLIGKLESYGISEDLIEWGKSFLTDRRHREYSGSTIVVLIFNKSPAERHGTNQTYIDSESLLGVGILYYPVVPFKKKL